jgi:hypothetical protein
VSHFGLFQGALGTVLVVLAVVEGRARRGLLRYAVRTALTVAAVGNIGFVVFLCFNHIGFPLHLDLMEGVVQQHVQHAAAGLPIYPRPTPGYVPLAYNPGFYLLAVPFTWIGGVTLPTLRFVAILGTLGSAIVIFLAVRDLTDSRWWGLLGAGLFAASYRAMDAYLDTAHADSWLLFSALLGTWMISRSRTRSVRVAGVVVLALAFWFKQHGALFTLAGVLYLTWREGPRNAWPYWLVAGLLGPAAYALGQAWPFGEWFHYFTWSVPSGWTELTLHTTVIRLATHVGRWYMVPCLAALAALLRAARRPGAFNEWHAAFLAGLASAAMGTLDPGSADNVFILFGGTCVLLGVAGLAAASEARAWKTIALAGVGVAFVALLYDPREMVMSSKARDAYRDLVTVLHGLEGAVYAPYQATLPSGFEVYPNMHWVALDDMTRGPHQPAGGRALALRLLESVRNPGGQAFLLNNRPLELTRPPVSSLAPSYKLARDFGDRFEPLAGTPRRFFHAWPRYLYLHVAPRPERQR